MQIVDREKLLNGPKEPTEANLRYPQITRLDFPPDVGAHTAFPLLSMDAEFAEVRPGGSGGARTGKPAKRDFIVVTGESTANECRRTGRCCGFVDITIESKPFGVSTWTVPEASGNFCDARRTLRHALVEREPHADLLQSRDVPRAFQCRRRAIDIRDPFNPKEIGFFIPAMTEQDRQALRRHRRGPALQGGDPDQQRRSR